MRYECVNLVAADPERWQAEFAAAVRSGLSERPKRLECRYFYDEAGSLLFEEICALPEYYLTRAETEILAGCADTAAAASTAAASIVELGSGSATKTRLLIDAFLRRHGRARYVPIDISPSMLEASARGLLRDYPNLEIQALAAEYEQGLRRLHAERGRPKLVLWLGSNVGNLHRDEAAAFLRRVRGSLSAEDRLLMGIDLRKDPAVLRRAYADARGVTARFNLNLLVRINRELAGEFDPGRFRHRAEYVEGAGRVEMYLDSSADQRVRIGDLGVEVEFTAGEPVHTENSYKYSQPEIESLAAAASLRLAEQWFDQDRRFTDVLLAPA